MKSPPMRCVPIWLACCSFFAEARADPARQVRFLALGESPPFQQEVRGDVRYEIEPAAGSIPPREVLLAFGGERSEPMRLVLGEISLPVEAPSGTGPLVLGLRGEARDAEPWLRLTRPESGDFLVLLWRDSKQGSWQRVRALMVPDDALNAPAGSVRYINVSTATVGIKVGAENLALEAGKMFKRTVAVGVEQTFEVLLPDTTGALKRLHSGVVLQNPGERSLVLVYLADGVGRRRPLKVTVQREQAPVTPPKK